MPNHHCSINQLHMSYCDDAFLNVRDQSPGELGIWGSTYVQPTYLMVNNLTFHLITYGSRAFAAEGLRKLSRSYKNVYRIVGDGLVQIKGEGVTYPDPTPPDDEPEVEDPIRAEFGKIYEQVYFGCWQLQMDSISADILTLSKGASDKEIIDWLTRQLADARARDETRKTEAYWASEAIE